MSDNFAALAGVNILDWTQEQQIEWHDIAPKEPWQNDYVESFNGRQRDQCLNELRFAALDHAQSILQAWRDGYNHVQPHSKIGGLVPVDDTRRLVHLRL